MDQPTCKEWYRAYRKADAETKRRMRTEIRAIRCKEYQTYADQWNDAVPQSAGGSGAGKDEAVLF